MATVKQARMMDASEIETRVTLPQAVELLIEEVDTMLEIDPDAAYERLHGEVSSVMHMFGYWRKRLQVHTTAASRSPNQNRLLRALQTMDEVMEWEYDDEHALIWDDEEFVPSGAEDGLEVEIWENGGTLCCPDGFDVDGALEHLREVACFPDVGSSRKNHDFSASPFKEMADEIFEFLPYVVKGAKNALSISALARAVNLNKSVIRDWRPYNNHRNGGMSMRDALELVEKKVAAQLDALVREKRAITTLEVQRMMADAGQKVGLVDYRPCERTARNWLTFRFGYTIRRAHYKRRPTHVSAEGKRAFVEAIDAAKTRHGADCVIGFDESYNSEAIDAVRVWRPIAAEDVQVGGSTQEKAGHTVFAGISAQGQWTRPIFIAKGKTVRCHKQFRVDGEDLRDDGQYIEDAFIAHSPTGWMNEQLCIWVLEHIGEIAPWTAGRRVTIVWDVYAAHKTERVKAQALGIDLLFVPPGCTDELQPLDRAVFGAVKSSFKALWIDFMTRPGNEKVTRAQAARWFMTVAAKTSPRALQAAWDFEELRSRNFE